MTESSENPGPPTPIARLIAESEQTYTELGRRMGEFLSPGTQVQRQTVAHYAQQPIVRMPSPDMMRALAHTLKVSPALVLHLFIASHEQHYRELMGIAEPPAGALESQAHALADRLDALEADARRRLLWVLRSLVETAEAEAAESVTISPEVAAGDVEAQESTGDRLRRLGDRLLVDIGAAYDDEAVQKDAEAVMDLLARRRRDDSQEESGDSSRAS